MFKKINLQLFAEDPKDKPNDDDPNDDPNNNPDDLDDPDSKGRDNDDDEGGKQVTMTQAQLDSLLKKSFAKGARKAKSGAKPTGGNSDEGGQDSDVEARIQKANEVMLAGTIKSVAADLGLTSKGAKAAVKLGDFSDCFNEQGEIDEEAVKDNLADFLKEYPEFAVKKDGDKGKGGFKFGADNKQDQDADDEALLSAFGVKKKG